MVASPPVPPSFGPSPVRPRSRHCGEMLSQVCCAAEWIQGMALGTLPVHSSTPAVMLQWGFLGAQPRGGSWVPQGSRRTWALGGLLSLVGSGAGAL